MKIENILVEKIDFDKEQPRKDITKIKDLAGSIRKQGLIQPIEITKEKNDKYLLVDGERRLRAYILLKREKIPCIVKDNVEDRFLRQLVSDFHKERLSLIDQANAVQLLISKKKTAHEIKKLLGLGNTSYYTLRKIPEFNERTQDFIRKGMLKAHQIHAISNVDIVEGKENAIIDEIIESGVEDAEEIRNILMTKQDIKFIINRFMTDCYYFEKKVNIINEQLIKHEDLIEWRKKQEMKNRNQELQGELHVLKDRINMIIKDLK